MVARPAMAAKALMLTEINMKVLPQPEGEVEAKAVVIPGLYPVQGLRIRLLFLQAGATPDSIHKVKPAPLQEQQIRGRGEQLQNQPHQEAASRGKAPPLKVVQSPLNHPLQRVHPQTEGKS